MSWGRLPPLLLLAVAGCTDVPLAVVWEMPPDLSPSDLRAAWTTPNTILWQWSIDGGLSQFAALELSVAQSAGDAQGRVGSAHLWTSAENPELGVAYLNTDPERDPVVSTLTTGLEPGTEYWAELTVVDKLGRRASVTSDTPATTGTSSAELVIFSEGTLPGAFPIPNDFTVGATDPFSGGYDAEYVAGADALTHPGEWLRWQGLDLSTSAVPQERFDDGSAFLEFAVQNRGETSLWSSVRLGFGVCESTPRVTLSPLTFPGRRAYRLFQVPLRALSWPAPTTASDDFHLGLCEFGVYGKWTSGQLVLVDEVRIRW